MTEQELARAFAKVLAERDARKAEQEMKEATAQVRVRCTFVALLLAFLGICSATGWSPF